VSKPDMDDLRTKAANGTAARLDSVNGIHQLQQIFTDFLQPQLHGSHTAPLILGFGQHLPFIGHTGPKDLHPAPSPSPSPNATATPSASPKKS
jgi:hypothetical protein